MPEEEARNGGRSATSVEAGENVTAVDKELAERRQKVLVERRFFIESRLDHAGRSRCVPAAR